MTRHDDCVAIHENGCGPTPPGDGDAADPIWCGYGNFVSCGEEVTTPDPGKCYGEVLCDGPPPTCPPNTLPGVLDGCWSGYCIPVDDCEPPPVACASIGDETTCVDRFDCTPLYEGVDCVCDEFGMCECADWLFVSCE